MFDHFFHMFVAPPLLEKPRISASSVAAKGALAAVLCATKSVARDSKAVENRGKGGENGETPWKTGAFHGKMWENLWKSSRNGDFQWF